MFPESVQTLFEARHRQSGAEMPGNQIYTLRRQERSLIFGAIFQEIYIGNIFQGIYIRKYISGNGVTPSYQETRPSEMEVYHRDTRNITIHKWPNEMI